MANSFEERNKHTEETNLWIMENYPVQDDIWPSRRWKADGSDYMDMSGYDTEDESYILSSDNKCNTLRALIETVEKDHPEFQEEHTTGWDMMQSARLFLAELLRNKDIGAQGIFG